MTVGDRIRALRIQNNLTLAELGKRIGSTPSAVKKWEDGDIANVKASTLKKIADALGTTPGYLMDWGDAVPWADSILSVPETKQVPVIGTIACGTPILAEENLEGYATINKDSDVDFALRCKGYSMVGARIYDGDIVYIRQQPVVENGEIAAVLIDDEATLKRVYVSPDKIELRAENPAFPSMVFEGNDRSKVRILGKAILFVGKIA